MSYMLVFLLSFIISLGLTPLVRNFAMKKGLVSFPRADRWHKRPTAMMGGVAIYIATVIPSLFVLGSNRSILALLAGGSFLFVVGLLDDKYQILPYTKLFAQIIAGSIAVLFGVIIGLPVNSLLGIPLTLIWIVGVTNSFNLLDNIDGLAAGIASICSLMLFFSSLIFANNPLGVFGLILAGACLGFLPYNFNPAKIFMGDSGSMFLGYSLAVISVAGTAKHMTNLLVTLLVPVLILSVPIFDTIFVMIIRSIQRRRIFSGGKDHTSHHLVTLGLSQKKTVVLLYVISIVLGLIGVSYTKINKFVILAVSFLALVILIFFGVFLFEGIYYGKRREAANGDPENGDLSGNKTVLNAVFMHKRRIAEVMLDFVSILLAYYCAYFLRFEGDLLRGNLEIMRQSLVWIILIKMSVFFMLGLYRGVWRYAGISDFFTIFKVVSLGSLISVFFLTYFSRFQNYSRAVFFIDWIVLLFLVMGSRFMFRLVGEFISRMQTEGARVIIFGAGDIGEMVVREIRRNKGLGFIAAGFIDDDPHKKGRKIHGIAVLGTRKKLKDAIKKHNATEVIIAVSKISQQDMEEISGICSECGVSFRKVKGILDK